jgi:hypothetical protein
MTPDITRRRFGAKQSCISPKKALHGEAIQTPQGREDRLVNRSIYSSFE